MKNIIYYAHHIRKYNTEEERKEINIINNKFNNSLIINPNGWIAQENDEKSIMNQCFKFVELSDIIIFTSMNGIIGKGVYYEIKHALDNNKKLYYLNNGIFNTFTYDNFNNIEIIYSITNNNREFAIINE